MSDYKIVCIDDENEILTYLSSLLEYKGFEVVTFTNPEEGLSFVLQNHKQVLMTICDFKMPELSGFDVRKKMLEKGIEIPFAIFTAFYDKQMAADAMRLRVCEFISKPGNEEDFRAVIDREVNGRLESIKEEREMVQDFLDETSPMLEEIEELILALEADPHDERAINTYFRLLHTIKGTASCLGLESLAGYAHHYEDLITKVKNHELSVNQAVIDVLLKGFDYLKTMYDCETNGKVYPFDVNEVTKIFESGFKEGDSAKSDHASEHADPQSSRSESKKSEKEERITVPVDSLTEFLELSGELTVLKNTIFKSLVKLTQKYQGDHDIEMLGETITEMHKVSSLLQNQIGEMKKVSVESVFKPMRRVVRDASKACKKEINFVTEGGDLRVDTSVGKLLNNVLVHMLRNSVDHGVEKPEVREERGKTPEGNVTLNCYETGEDIYVEIVDDGGGINKDFIALKAIEKGLYSQDEINKMSDNRIYNIIFDSGFSTAEKITAVSGRGVGMDMVRSSIEEMGGKIYIDSKLGEGSKFVLAIPIPRSILIIKSLSVKSAGMSFNIPLDNVAEVVNYEGEKNGDCLHNIEGSLVLRHHEVLIPLVNLSKTLGHETNYDDKFNIVIVKGDGFKYGMVVDQIDDIEEIVVKKLNPPLNQSVHFMGATFVGDGELSLILDLEGIAKEKSLYGNQEDEDLTTVFGSGVNTSFAREYMRFKMGDMENYCLPLDAVHRLEVIERKTIEYSGSRPIVKYRGGGLPLYVIGDRLGLMTTEAFDKVKVPEFINVIVVQNADKLYGLVIDEIIDIATTYQEADASVVDREGLLGTIFIDEKIITVVDINHIIGVMKKAEEGASDSYEEAPVIENKAA
jgi:two-component system, chemotaxis family, sensor kinase CheA